MGRSVYRERDTFLFSPTQVIRALITYTDWWQPHTTSVMEVGRTRHGFGDGFPQGLLSTLDERTELCWRMRQVGERDRRLLFLWYVRQVTVDEASKELGISRRQVFRRRAAAIKKIVELGEEQVA